MVNDKSTVYVKDLVLIPGLNNTKEVWEGVVQNLPPSIQCHTPNCPPMNDVDMIAEELLKELPARFHLCGFSFGGYVALAMLAKAPERISGFALVGSLPYADSEAQKKNRKAAISRAKKGEHQEMVASQAHLVFHPDNLEKKELKALREKIVDDYGPERFIVHQQASIDRPDRTHLVKALSIPFLMLSGEKDVVIPVEKQRELANQIKGARFEVIETAGHMVPLENPIAIAENLLTWLTEN